ncbi:MAG: tetratricopeptide repeat protein [Bacteroidetes bacterium]|nr:tetratricopeptide repeat protein [Bacteroidota bacterium]
MKINVLVALMLISTFTWAQKKKKNEKSEPAKQEAQQTQPTQSAKTTKTQDSVRQMNPLVRHYFIKYTTALQWNDYELAKDALYDLIVEDPGNDSLIYQLAVYYYQNQKYPSAALVSQELLRRNPKNTDALEVAGFSYENIGVLDRALQSYESLFLLQNNPVTLYKMAFIQLKLKRYKESATSADILMSDARVDSLKVNYTGENNQEKEYPMKVALLNLKGMIAQEQGDKPAAQKLFDQALALAPDFTPAKENLAKLK